MNMVFCYSNELWNVVYLQVDDFDTLEEFAGQAYEFKRILPGYNRILQKQLTLVKREVKKEKEHFDIILGFQQAYSSESKDPE